MVDSLSRDVLSCIFNYCDLSTIIAVRLVSRRFCEVTHSRLLATGTWWNTIYRFQNRLPEWFLLKYSKQFGWNNICRFHNLSEPFMRTHADKLNWFYVSNKQGALSESFIRDFAGDPDPLSPKFMVGPQVYWPYISSYQNLSESFLREFADRLDWSHISQYQKLSEPFIREFMAKLNLPRVLNSQDLSKKFYKEIKEYIRS